MTKRDPRDLLVDATPKRASDLDLDAIDRRVKRRRAGKAAGAAVTAVALVLIGLVGVPQLLDGSVLEGPAIDPVTEPERPDPRPTADQDAAPSGEQTVEAQAVPVLDSVLGLGAALSGGQHLVVEDGSGLTITAVDSLATVATLADWSIASEPGLRWTPPGPIQVRNENLVATAGDGHVDVTNGEVLVPGAGGAQHRVGMLRFSPGDPAPILARRYGGGDPATAATWPGGSLWSISADRTTVTYCPDGELDCDLATLDAVTGETGGTSPGCHVADTSIDGFVMSACGSVLTITELETGRTFNREPGFDGTWDGYETITAAAWSPTADVAAGEVLVEARNECGAPIVLRGGEGLGPLQPIGFPFEGPTASELVGWTTDGRAIVRSLTQGCGNVAGGDGIVWIEDTEEGTWGTLGFPADDGSEVRLHTPMPWMAEQELVRGTISELDLAGELVLDAEDGESTTTRLPLAGVQVTDERWNVVGVTTPDGDITLAELAEELSEDPAARGALFELHLVDGEVAWIRQVPSP